MPSPTVKRNSTWQIHHKRCSLPFLAAKVHSHHEVEAVVEEDGVVEVLDVVEVGFDSPLSTLYGGQAPHPHFRLLLDVDLREIHRESSPCSAHPPPDQRFQPPPKHPGSHPAQGPLARVEVDHHVEEVEGPSDPPDRAAVFLSPSS